MGKMRIIPNIKVNYSLWDIIKSLFIRSQGYYIEKTKNTIAHIFHNRNIIFTCSGRSALFHVLSVLPQNKVVVPAYTCDVVVEAAKLAGKSVVYAHVDKESLNIAKVPSVDNDSIVIATHQYGFPCKIKDICEFCKERGAIVIEDCAGALGTFVDGQPAGTYGDYAVFSFNASKLINSPASGGFILVNKEDKYTSLRMSIDFKPCTFKYKYVNLCKSLAFCLDKHDHIHYWLSKATRHDATKAHISADSYSPNKTQLEEYRFGFYNWQAYVVLKQLERLPYLLEQRETLSRIYQEKLHYNLEAFNRQKSCIRYPIYIENREETRFRLREKGIEIGFGFEHFVCPDDFTDEITMAQRIAYLPYGSNFSEKEINYIVHVLNEDLNEQSSNT